MQNPRDTGSWLKWVIIGIIIAALTVIGVVGGAIILFIMRLLGK